MAETPFPSEPSAASGGDSSPAGVPAEVPSEAGVSAEPVVPSEAVEPAVAVEPPEEAREQAPGGIPVAAAPAGSASVESAPPAVPVPAPAPASAAEPPAVEPAPAAEEPAIAATYEAPPTAAPPGGTAGEGGEWELLIGKLRAWLATGELQHGWERLQGPLKGLAYLIGLVLLLRVYGAVVGTIDRIPLISGLLELTGLIAVVRFSFRNLVKTSEREKVFAAWRKRWDDFRGAA